MIGDQVPAIHCEIDVSTSGQQISLRGRVEAKADGDARYSLVVNKSGPGGNSAIRQAGAFHTLAVTPVFVGSVVLDYQKTAVYTANLDILYDGKSFICDFKTGDTHE